MRRQTIAIIVVAVVAVAGFEYYLQSNNSKTGPGPSAATINITIYGGVGNGTTDRYSPDNFTVRQGQQVTLAILNTDDNTHGLVIDALKVNTGLIHGGKTDRITFTANQTGTFTYYEPPGYCTGGFGNVCNSAQHMIGTMTVIP
jgi:heme/copper-type cytochrome/quinol oxidase subunit 2